MHRLSLLPLALLLACAEPLTDDTSDPGCVDGLDHDGDGVCDREVADWTEDASIPLGTTRANVYDLPPDVLAETRIAGLGHASVWPVTVSGMLLPWGPIQRFFSGDPEAATVTALARSVLGFGTMDEMYAWLGLPHYGDPDDDLPYATPLPDGVAMGDPMGTGVIETDMGEALSFSCALCHVADLFGTPVVGMTNKQARANEFFHLAAQFFPDIPAETFEEVTGADEDEMALFVRTQVNLPSVGIVPPVVRGLDTSLAQVGLSLARRNEDAYATKNPEFENSPRPNELSTFVADSKPAVWWTMKHKTRWLSDGSIVSGNPVFTNFLWNELGRGTDLEELEGWMRDNRRVADELTVAVFASEAPKWVDFFGADSLDLEAAKRGQATFDAMCAECHGTYVKGWEADDADSRDAEGLLETVELRYHEKTPVLDVGTDAQRAKGMSYFADDLNRLAISEWMKTRVEVQTGYVPQPLDGIWARWPYLHNASVPTLCDLLSPGDERTEVFWMGPTDDPETDFDADCVGYPTGDAVPESWVDEADRRFDTTEPGLGNEGHDAWLLDGDGQPVLDADARADLIAFLKTL